MQSNLQFHRWWDIACTSLDTWRHLLRGILSNFLHSVCPWFLFTGYKFTISVTQRTNNDFLLFFPISWNTISCNSFRFWLCFIDEYQRKKLQTLNKLSKWYVGILDSVLLWFKEGGGQQFGRVINGLSANISHPVMWYYDNNVLWR